MSSILSPYYAHHSRDSFVFAGVKNKNGMWSIFDMVESNPKIINLNVWFIGSLVHWFIGIDGMANRCILMFIKPSKRGLSSCNDS